MLYELPYEEEKRVEVAELYMLYMKIQFKVTEYGTIKLGGEMGFGGWGN